MTASICAAVCHDTFERAVRFAIRLGGDTDTTAAVTGAITGARDGAAGIPPAGYALDDGARGRSHVETMGTHLIAARR